MKFSHNTKIFRGQPDFAPFAGVFFLLLLFLLGHSALVFTPGVKIELPEAAGLAGVANLTVAVAVDEAGQFYFENQIIDEARLREKLAAEVARAREPLTLVVLADRNARSEVVVRLGLLARAAGIKEMLQATRPPVAPPAPARP